jgi:hypothetical protein
MTPRFRIALIIATGAVLALIVLLRLEMYLIDLGNW